MKILHAIKTFLVDWFEKNEADILGFIFALPFIILMLALLVQCTGLE